ncbi:cytochrome d ubiquinol oxidase subunit II [Amycolatopsis xylanica]|uniref:Cytochrome d ubiquinol oxidase subunit II n=1 Tax=Amycolatopsis xylanica TaxID=589385 RepID=A0A1H3MB99_9PSEU|nr:cytochrome d ubiquinol oxidase subunit II [Amycolatopsis xylanica]SDY73971.1 cytochrome d ubiquinol oxidase subunit II [Amycolatopsis xylanica]
MVTLWWGVLGLLIAAYFALAGYDYGIGMLLRGFGGDQRRVLGSLGPFFLANEVWLVAAVGVLFGAFPHLEGRVFSGAYVLVVTLLLGLVTFTASVQLRGRNPGTRGALWSFGIGVGALVTAVSWGLFLGNLVRGVPSGDVLGLFTPYAVLWGAGFVALFALQGAVFLTVRAPEDLVGRARRLATSLVAPVLAFLVVATLWGLVELEGATWRGIPVVAVAFAALAVVFAGLRARRYRVALAAAMVLAAAPVALVGLLRFPVVYTSTVDTLTVDQAATSAETFKLLTAFGVPSIVLMIAVQWVTWRANRGRVDQRSPLHF